MDNSSIAERVINVHTTRPYQWVLDNVFSEGVCGLRNRTLFWKSDKPGTSHFFIEFAHKDSVPRAQREAIQGVTVHCLSRNMNMFPIFDCLARGLEPPRKRPNTDAESPAAESQGSARSFHSPIGPPAPKRQRIYDQSASAPARPSPTPSFREPHPKPYRQSAPFPHYSRDPPARPHPNDIPKPKPAWAPNSEPRRYANNSSSNYHKPRPRNDDFQNSQNSNRSPPRRPQHDRREDDHALPYRNGNMDSPSPAHRRFSDASDPAPPPSPISFGSAPSAPSRLFTPVRQPDPAGPQWPDLDAITDDNVTTIINSLQTSMSGPESWMTVAASYRQRMLHKSALAVVSTMLEVMQGRGMAKTDLKPALLLMAQCHYSIAKQEEKKTEADSAEESGRYFVLLLEWLRQTYGDHTPAVDALTRSGALASEPPGAGSPWTPEKEKESKPFLARDDGPRRSSLFSRDPLRPVPGAPAPAPPDAAARLERASEELRGAHESHRATMAALAAARVGKLEAETAQREEAGRARALERELARVRDAERVAAARALRETDARRRTEERLVQERAAWDRRAEEARADATRGVVESLAAILTLSARAPAPAPVIDAARVFCEARARAERAAPDKP
ncbi:hypothetical protein DFH11DRAFT_1740159 [Phellopilus nigrolimitatus]|nr:hypothetical protein DFH11DRAFT_1740159 [Phellopilus nigrolimitatus]